MVVALRLAHGRRGRGLPGVRRAPGRDGADGAARAGGRRRPVVRERGGPRPGVAAQLPRARGGSLVDDQAGLIWRKVARREPSKLARKLQALASAAHPSLRVPGLDAVFPPGAIDFEDRPYHLGWLFLAFPKRRRTSRAAARAMTSPAPVPVRHILGVPVDAMTMDEVLDRVQDAIARRAPLQIGVVNAAKVVNMRRDPALRDDVLSSDLILADGIAVVWAEPPPGTAPARARAGHRPDARDAAARRHARLARLLPGRDEGGARRRARAHGGGLPGSAGRRQPGRLLQGRRGTGGRRGHRRRAGRHPARGHDLPEEGEVPGPLERDARGSRVPRRRRLLRRDGGQGRACARPLAAARPGVAVPREAGAAPALAALPGDERALLRDVVLGVRPLAARPPHRLAGRHGDRPALIRLSLLYLVITGLAVYAWRDWFKALCGLILLMGVIQHPDMPKNLLGVQGLNPWNLLLMSVLGAWASARRREGLRWDLPRYLAVLLGLYMLVVVVSFLRLIPQRGLLSDEYTMAGIVSEYFVNALKWIVPGLLLFDGCRTPRALLLGGRLYARRLRAARDPGHQVDAHRLRALGRPAGGAQRQDPHPRGRLPPREPLDDAGRGVLGALLGAHAPAGVLAGAGRRGAVGHGAVRPVADGGAHGLRHLGDRGPRAVPAALARLSAAGAGGRLRDRDGGARRVRALHAGIRQGR